jgi:predicted DCC family thiol-disulfide oxidoreductase YuxK
MSDPHSSADASPSSSSATHHVVLYDSDCPLCTFQMKSLTWLDWLDRVRFVPIASARAAEIAPQLTREDLMEAIHCVTPSGDIHRGARAIRFLGLRMPLLVPVALFLWVPGVIWVAEMVYRFVSRHRLVFSRLFGCKGACALMPQKSRDGEVP